MAVRSDPELARMVGEVAAASQADITTIGALAQGLAATAVPSGLVCSTLVEDTHTGMTEARLVTIHLLLNVADKISQLRQPMAAYVLSWLADWCCKWNQMCHTDLLRFRSIAYR